MLTTTIGIGFSDRKKMGTGGGPAPFELPPVRKDSSRMRQESLPYQQAPHPYVNLNPFESAKESVNLEPSSKNETDNDRFCAEFHSESDANDSEEIDARREQIGVAGKPSHAGKHG